MTREGSSQDFPEGGTKTKKKNVDCRKWEKRFYMLTNTVYIKIH